ncbi:hypothetical protein ACIHDR_46815 [Nocardia sp. NPDC052278]|uniref:hypothetical protein n=1 Tax=unclassified Nocardia TaxID=2637762 RepID=UPI0036C463FA
MSDTFDYGPLDTYKITWSDGRITYLQAHQITVPHPVSTSIFPGRNKGRWTIHSQIQGRWTLILTVPDKDIRSVRNMTHTDDNAVGQY